MTFSRLDVVVFVSFHACVLVLSLVKSRGRKDAADYFLGGRALPWWLIGVSIVAANISTEQFVGMASQAAGNVGLAVAVYVLVTTAAVLYSGATTLETVFGIPLVNGVVLIAALAVAYSTRGGLLSLGSEGAPTASDSGC